MFRGNILIVLRTQYDVLTFGYTCFFVFIVSSDYYDMIDLYSVGVFLAVVMT